MNIIMQHAEAHGLALKIMEEYEQYPSLGLYHILDYHVIKHPLNGATEFEALVVQYVHTIQANPKEA